MPSPSQNQPNGFAFDTAFGEDLVLSLDLKSEATIAPNHEDKENYLTITNHGPNGSIEIERNGNLVSLSQKSPDENKIGNSKVEILVPHRFLRMNMVLSDSANIQSAAAPLATIIKSTGDIMGDIYTCDCLADLDGDMTSINIHMMESQKQVGGEMVTERHNLFLMSSGGGAHEVDGRIGNAYYLVEDCSTVRVLANATTNLHAYGPKTRWRFDHNILLLSGPVSGEKKIRGVSQRRLAVKREQMVRYFNWCVRQKAMQLT